MVLFQLQWSIPVSVFLMSFSLWFNYIDQTDIPEEERKKSAKRRRKLTAAQKKEEDKIDEPLFSMMGIRIRAYRFE